MSSHPAQTGSHTAVDMFYDAVHSGAIGGSVVALFFLVVDAITHEPFFTPSLMGSVLFEGADAASVTGVRLDMVAYYTVIHFATFAVLGAVISFLVHEVELHSRHPGELLLLGFLIFEGGFFIAARLFMPGVATVVGPFRLFVANLLAVAAMALFFAWSHRPDALHRIRQRALG